VKYHIHGMGANVFDHQGMYVLRRAVGWWSGRRRFEFPTYLAASPNGPDLIYGMCSTYDEPMFPGPSALASFFIWIPHVSLSMQHPSCRSYSSHVSGCIDMFNSSCCFYLYL
jgi:hypothetical protein